MERNLLEDMIELAKREKIKWDKCIKEITGELKKEGGKTSAYLRKAGRPRNTKTAVMETKIIEVLENADKSMRPKEIAQTISELGTEVKPALVRQILFRLKDKKFISPEQGLWKLKGKQ